MSHYTNHGAVDPGSFTGALHDVMLVLNDIQLN
jgi:hypothetical protein